MLLMTMENVCKNEELGDKKIVKVEFEGEIINALEELEKYRKKNKFLKEKLSKHKEQVEKITK